MNSIQYVLNLDLKQKLLKPLEIKIMKGYNAISYGEMEQ